MSREGRGHELSLRIEERKSILLSLEMNGMDSQITKIPSICGDSYPGVGYQVDSGDSVRVAMAWPSASAEGWRSLTMEVPKKLSLETELNGVSVDYLLQRADVLFGDGDLGGFKRYERALGDKLPSAVVRAFARYAPIDLTHIGTAETCRDEIVQFLGGEIPELGSEGAEKVSGKTRAVLVPVGQDPVAIEIGSWHDIMNHVGGIFDQASGNLPPDALPFNLSMYVNDEGFYTSQPNRAFFATERMEQEGYLSPVDDKPVLAGLPTSVLYGNIVVTGFNPATGEDVSLSDGEMMDAMNYFQRDSPRGSGHDVAFIVQNHLYGELRESLSQESSGHEDKTLDNAGESLDEMMEQKVELAGDNEIGDELNVSNGER